MNAVHLGFVAALGCVTMAACSIGAPERASNIQNLNAITDDIWSVDMTRSSRRRFTIRTCRRPSRTTGRCRPTRAGVRLQRAARDL